MTVAISFGNIREAMEFIWERQGGFGEHGPFFGVEGEFSLVRASDGAGRSDDVACVGPCFEILGMVGVKGRPERVETRVKYENGMSANDDGMFTGVSRQRSESVQLDVSSFSIDNNENTTSSRISHGSLCSRH